MSAFLCKNINFRKSEKGAHWLKVYLLEGAMKRLYLSVVIFVLVVGFSTISWAEGKLPLQGSIGVGARLYGFFPKSDTLRGQRLDFENALGGEINVTYRFLKYLALEGAVGYTEFDIKNETLAVDWARVEVLPISLTLQFRWISKKPEELKWIVPYASLGGGYYFLNLEEKSELRVFWLSQNVAIDLEIDDAFFVTVGGGVDIFVTDHIALNFDAKYSWAQADIDETRITGGTSQTLGGTMNLNGAFVGAGFKFFF
jgi:outer membrane protein W